MAKSWETKPLSNVFIVITATLSLIALEYCRDYTPHPASFITFTPQKQDVAKSNEMVGTTSELIT